MTGPLATPSAGPKPGIRPGAVAEKVGSVGFTGPLAFTDLDVAAAAGGDRVAFAAIYDRYGPRLFDFCVGMLRDRDAAADCVQDTFVSAATRLGQLREPEKLRPWLYAIARHEALHRLRARRREHTVDEVPEQADPGAGPEALAGRSELATLIREAAGGLSERDRTVLELHYRHGLDGPELADALGVSHTNANTLVGRLRTTIERSLGALLLARRARAHRGRCLELDALVEGWDGQMTVPLRKRIARHIDGCATCETARAELVNPKALLASSAPIAVPAPFWLRDHVLTQSTPHLHAAHGTAQSAAGTGASWWPTGKTGALTGGWHGVHGLHGVHLAVAGPLVAAVIAVPIVVGAVVTGEPVTVAASTPPEAVAPAPSTAPRFGLDVPSTPAGPSSSRRPPSLLPPPAGAPPAAPKPGTPGLPAAPSAGPGSVDPRVVPAPGSPYTRHHEPPSTGHQSDPDRPGTQPPDSRTAHPSPPPEPTNGPSSTGPSGPGG